MRWTVLRCPPVEYGGTPWDLRHAETCAQAADAAGHVEVAQWLRDQPVP